ncbi:type VI secretion system-associated FHA domain protein [Vibrio penaeicida]|uniref:FHA domain-containing protein n=1 Tax=Vibrio penaeicida TaxID=104609 RepID=A0AAV5NZZ4_9VIBR|nr:FHA domain-containing protein [Vibrio penaeicida]RTZ23062.1 FHA domain-containing protein [Vibrio penaeicida]GLQ75893.1 hypothetical protein GCM10007932_52560 [Vibrio penaeicida]
MPLSIRIISSPDGESIAQWNQAFPEEGGDIGRAFGATLQLSDASREISGTHAIVRKTSRGYQIADNSTNGLFINGSDVPLGNGNQSTLSDGDVLDIGRYRLLVSCFVPDQAKAQSGSENLVASPFGDDPFSNEITPFIQDVPEVSDQPDFTISTLDVVDDDPFLHTDTIKQTQQTYLDLEFQTDDEDPLKDSDLHASFPLREVAATQPTTNNDINTVAQSTAFAMVERQSQEQRLQERTDKALEMALTRLFSDISPKTMESMFDDLSGSGFWSRKPKYWDMYKRYFTRQVENRDWQVKFQAYFRDAMRLQRNLEGEK